MKRAGLLSTASESGVRTVGLSAMVNLSLPLSALLTAPLLARALGVEDRGGYAAATSPIAIIAVLGTLGVQDTLTSFLSTRRVRWSTSLLILKSWLLRITAGTAIVTLVFIVLFFAKVSQPVLAAGFLVVTAPLAVGTSLLLGLAAGAGRFGIVNSNRIVTALGRITLIPVVFLLGRLSLASALAIFAIVQLAAFIALAVQLHRVRGELGALPGGREIPTNVTAAAMHMLFASAMAIGLARLDQALAPLSTSLAQLGLYAIAVAIAEVANSLVVALRTFLLGAPGIDSMRRPRQSAWVIGSMLVTALLALVGMALSKPLLPLLFGREFSGAIAPTQILLISVPFTVGMTVAATLLARKGRTWDQTISYALALIVNVGALFFLAPRNGALGLSAASVAAAVVGCGTATLLLMFVDRRS